MNKNTKIFLWVGGIAALGLILFGALRAGAQGTRTGGRGTGKTGTGTGTGTGVGVGVGVGAGAGVGKRACRIL